MSMSTRARGDNIFPDVLNGDPTAMDDLNSSLTRGRPCHVCLCLCSLAPQGVLSVVCGGNAACGRGRAGAPRIIVSNDDLRSIRHSMAI